MLSFYVVPKIKAVRGEIFSGAFFTHDSSRTWMTQISRMQSVPSLFSWREAPYASQDTIFRTQGSSGWASLSPHTPTIIDVISIGDGKTRRGFKG